MIVLPQILPLCLAIAATQAGDPARPLRLHVEREGMSTIIRVDALSDAPSSFGYELRVLNGSNRSTQRGTVQLNAGVPITIATVRLESPGKVAAELKVKSPSAAEYTEQFPGAR